MLKNKSSIDLGLRIKVKGGSNNLKKSLKYVRQNISRIIDHSKDEEVSF